MSKPILTQPTQNGTRPRTPATIIEIDLVRDGPHIFYNRRENGRIVHNAQRITRERAQQIYEANAGEAQQRTIGAIDFGPGPHTWSWTVKVIEGVS